MPDAHCHARYHGTATAYTKHRCRCESARAAWRRYKKQLAVGIHKPVLIDATGIHRRIQAMQVMGHSQAVIAAQAGLGKTKESVGRILASRQVHPRTAAKIRAACAELGMQQGPSRNTATLARQKGWVSLLAWDDIDDPHETPDTGEDVDTGEPDFAAVSELLAGRASYARAREPDQRAAVGTLWQRGYTPAETAGILGTTENAVIAARQRIRNRRHKAQKAQAS